MKHILIVDDVSTNLRCAEDVLQDRFQVSMVKSGEQAFSFLKKAKPDLILLDVIMPGMDGYEVLEKLQNSLEWCDIPVILLTADSNRGSETKGFQLGAMDFIKKPFEPEVMLSRIDRVLEIEDSRKKLEALASQDSLTKLWNRRTMEEMLNRYAADGKGAFFLIDLNDFKNINDSLGRVVGDCILIRFGQILKQFIQDEDMLCRIDGDEFAIFFADELDVSRLTEQAEAILSATEREICKISGCKNRNDFSVRIGIALMPTDGKNFEMLYNKSDKALYYAKQNRLFGYHFYAEKDSAFSEKNDLFSLDEIQKMLIRKEECSVSHLLGFDNFKRVYHFVQYFMKQTGLKAVLALFTLQMKENNAKKQAYLENNLLGRVSIYMREAISQSLCKGDLVSMLETGQCIVILMNTEMEQAQNLVENIKKSFLDDEEKEMLGIELVCALQKITGLD